MSHVYDRDRHEEHHGKVHKNIVLDFILGNRYFQSHFVYFPSHSGRIIQGMKNLRNKEVELM